jgi:transcriptional antiterminator NusG
MSDEHTLTDDKPAAPDDSPAADGAAVAPAVQELVRADEPPAEPGPDPAAEAPAAADAETVADFAVAPAAFESHAAGPETSEAGTAGEPEAAAGPETPAAPPAEPVPESKKKWYVVKVQSGREESIKAAIERKVKIEGLEEFYGQIAIPVERVTEVKKVRVTDKKTGEKVTQEKRVVKEKKKYQGYIFAEVEFNDAILYLFRETSGVGDFVGATQHRPPQPMTDRDVHSMLTGVVDKDEKGKGKKGGMPVKVKLDFEKGDKVRIRDGAFTNMEGEVKLITEPKDASENHKVTVVVTVFGRPVDVVVDHWHVDKV